MAISNENPRIPKDIPEHVKTYQPTDLEAVTHQICRQNCSTLHDAYWEDYWGYYLRLSQPSFVRLGENRVPAVVAVEYRHAVLARFQSVTVAIFDPRLRKDPISHLRPIQAGYIKFSLGEFVQGMQLLAKARFYQPHQTSADKPAEMRSAEAFTGGVNITFASAPKAEHVVGLFTGFIDTYHSTR